MEKILSAGATIAEGMNPLPFTAKERALYQEGFLHPFSHPEAFENDVGQVLILGGMARSSFGKAAFSGSKVLWAKGMRFFRGGAESSRLISSITRVSSNVANEPFINEEAIAAGWKPPYPENIMIREIIGSKNFDFVRVHTDRSKPTGGFLIREKVLARLDYNPEKIKQYLGLPETPIYITDVNIPAGTKLYVGRIGPQPNFGLASESGFQYQLEEIIPKNNFTNTRLLESLVENNTAFYQSKGGW